MQAVIRHGGKQYVVSENTLVRLPKLDPTIKELNFEVLAILDDQKSQIGAPVLADAKVSATVVGQRKTKKIIVGKYKSKVNYRRKIGHRDQQTIIKINSIQA
jgi:large subunit ribosomal protein L21